jgi:hypothetical protein
MSWFHAEQIETIRKETQGGPQDSDAAFARRTACGQRCRSAAIFLRHTKFPDFHHRSHHQTARTDSPADIGATRLAWRQLPPAARSTDCGKI